MTNTHTSDPYELVKLPTVMWDIDKVLPYAKNTKVHSDHQVAVLKADIRERGLYDAIIVDYEGVIIAGHGRRLALIALGQKVVPVKHAAHLTKNQADAARIAHNKTSSTEYDSGLMADELRRLLDSNDVDITTLGFDERELDFLAFDDIGEMNMGAISDDLEGDIDAQEEETQEKVAATDASSTKIVKALGFNEIPIAAVKDVRRFLADIEAKTGLSGAAAFAEFCRGR